MEKLLNETLINSNAATVSNSNSEQVLSLSSIEDLIKVLQAYVEKNYGPMEWRKDWTMTDAVNSVYTEYMYKKTAFIYALSDSTRPIPNTKTISEAFSNLFEQEEEKQTIKRSQNITKTDNTSWKKEKNATLKLSFTVPFLGTLELSDERGEESEGGTSTETSKTFTYWTQKIKVPPKSNSVVTSAIDYGKEKIYGMSRFVINLNGKIKTRPYIKSNGTVGRWGFTIRNMLAVLCQMGYKEWLSQDYKKFSVITTDNPVSPTWVTLNIPLSWENMPGTIKIEYDSKSL